jgi:hypothetical protein
MVTSGTLKSAMRAARAIPIHVESSTALSFYAPLYTNWKIAISSASQSGSRRAGHTLWHNGGLQRNRPWNIKQTGGTQIEVSFTESSSAFLISALCHNQKLGEHLQHWLNALKAEAERSA